jgi:quercetin dioxygenase-like cupin family protein
MKKVSVSEAVEYVAPKHHGCTTLRLQGKDETGTTQFSLGCSHFLPGGGAEFSPERPFDTVYLCTAGEITITDKDGKDIVLKPNDSIFIARDEGRSIENKTKYPASMFVILGYPV